MRGLAVAAVRCGRTKSRWVSVSRSVPVEKFDLDAQHVVEAPAALVDVVVAAAAAIQLATGGLLGDADGRVDRGHRVLLGDDEQDGAANGDGTSYRPTPGEAEQRPRGNPIAPFGAVLRGHKLLPEKGVLGGANGQVTGPTGARQVTRRAAEDRAETV